MTPTMTSIVIAAQLFLKNWLGLRNQDERGRFEAFITAQRADEPLPAGDLGYRHYCALHRHLFQDVYSWAGRIRTVRLSKAGHAFCYPENIDREMRRLFDGLANQNRLSGLDAGLFAEEAARFLAELNAIHPFREGNGRTQNVFLSILAANAGFLLNFRKLDPPQLLSAMIQSFLASDDP